MRQLIGSALVVVALAGCSGMRQSGSTYVAHAESIRVLGYAFPADDQQAALSRVPPGGTITNVSSTPADWNSLIGVLGNILWIHGTQIGGTIDAKIRSNA